MLSNLDECGELSSLGNRVKEIYERVGMTTEEMFQDIARAGEGERKYAVLGRGIMMNALFHHERLYAARGAIRALIKEVVVDELYEARGGGGSVRALLYDRAGSNWACPHVVDALICLAASIEDCRYCIADRTRWASLPHELPFIVFRDPEVSFVTIHLLVGGQCGCGAMRGVPVDWPDGHTWANMSDVHAVNCLGCQITVRNMTGNWASPNETGSA